MTQRQSISLKTTAACDGACRHCVARAWMGRNRGEFTSLEDIEALIVWSRTSEYRWRSIILTGGEPMLWRHLREAAELLRRSLIADELVMFTNALAAGSSGGFDRFVLACESLDRVRLSRYQGNEDEVNFILSRCVGGKIGRARVHTVNNAVWCIPPADPVPDSLPADCTCRSYGLWKRSLTLCAPIEMLYDRNRWDKSRLPCTEVNRAGFLSDLERIDPTRQDACRYCVGNSKVAARATRTRNRVR